MTFIEKRTEMCVVILLLAMTMGCALRPSHRHQSTPTAESLDTTKKEFVVELVERDELPEVLRSFEKSRDPRRIDSKGWYFLYELTDREADAARKIKGIARVEENVLIDLMAELRPSDTLFGRQCGMEQIEAPAAWNSITKSPRVNLALIDSGVTPGHPDLDWTILGGEDENGHGTHVAGIVSALSDGNGVVGVSWDYDHLRSYRFLDENGRGRLESALKEIDRAVADGANIVVLPWGTHGFLETLRSSLLRANTVLFVAAAGNDSRDMDDPARQDLRIYPAAFSESVPNLISVMAVNCDGSPAWFTNYGLKSVQIAAPGDGPHPAYRIYSTALESKHGPLAGTSMATGFVAGAAALVMEKLGTFDDPVRIRKKLVDSATPFPQPYYNYCESHGYLNVGRAVQP